MAMMSGPGGVDVEAALRRAGVEFVHVGGDDAPESLVATVLPPGETEVRLTVVAEPPPPGQEFSGMGAWHVNAVDEVHFVRSGRGLIQFAVPEGICTVEVLPGDVMIVRRCEHRYRPLESQGWIMRHSGDADAQLDPRETGRASDPWPTDPG